MKPQGSVLQLLRVSRTVSDLARAAVFYTGALDFKQKSATAIADPAWAELMGIPGARARSVILQLGNQELELLAFDPPGRPYPSDSDATDLWFQHIAIVVTDMDAAHAQLNYYPFSAITEGGPQHLPPNTGSVTAFKFRDPDGHPVELIRFPSGTGNPIWQQQSSPLFLGIDHSAIAVADTEQSIDFYTHLLGFNIASRSVNSGPEQARLDCAPQVKVNVIALQPQIQGPAHVELLGYEQPAGRAIPVDIKSNDITAERLILQVSDLPELMARLETENTELISQGIVKLRDGQRAALIKDPTDHMLLLMEPDDS
ncbi:MAG: VOC family protein [Gammaproteobacteria bacterium]